MERRVEVRARDMRFDAIKFDKAVCEGFDKLADTIMLEHGIVSIARDYAPKPAAGGPISCLWPRVLPETSLSELASEFDDDRTTALSLHPRFYASKDVDPGCRLLGYKYRGAVNHARSCPGLADLLSGGGNP